MAESTSSPFTARDGTNLVLVDWPLEQGPVRGVVLLVHGLGEHAWRYAHVAERLNEWGFVVRAYDQYGHGESMGPRGALTSADRLVQDLVDVVDESRTRMHDGTPLILLGHSLGGLVAACVVAEGLRPVEGLVLSSPAFDAGFGPLQKMLLAVVPRLAPDLRVGNGLDPALLSHDAGVVAAYRADPLVHDRIAARLAAFIADRGPRTVARAAQWSVPTLLMYAGDDGIVRASGSQAFALAAPAAVVSAQRFDGLYHELFNESQEHRERVFSHLRAWLDARF